MISTTIPMTILGWIHSFILLVNYLLFIFTLLIVIGVNLSFIYTRHKKNNHHHLDVESTEIVVRDVSFDDPAIILIIPCSENINNRIEEEKISTSFISDNENIICQPWRKISCFCDGSYSEKTQIGFSGFRTLNGYCKYQRCPLRSLRSASTESEVFAACLALEYTAQDKYDQIVIYTDNSKVEQLLTRPKSKDPFDYPRLFTALKQNKSNIVVKRVPGHPTRYEQKQSIINQLFAQADYEVREKRREFEQNELQWNKNIRISSAKKYFNLSSNRSFRTFDSQRSGKTIIKTSLYRSKSFPLLKN